MFGKPRASSATASRKVPASTPPLGPSPPSRPPSAGFKRTFLQNRRERPKAPPPARAWPPIVASLRTPRRRETELGPLPRGPRLRPGSSPPIVQRLKSMMNQRRRSQLGVGSPLAQLDIAAGADARLAHEPFDRAFATLERDFEKAFEETATRVASDPAPLKAEPSEAPKADADAEAEAGDRALMSTVMGVQLRGATAAPFSPGDVSRIISRPARPGFSSILDEAVPLAIEVKRPEPPRMERSDMGRTLLREALAANLSRVIDLFRRYDVDGSGEVDRPEFRKGVRSTLGGARREVAVHPLRQKELLLLLAAFKQQHRDGVCKVSRFDKLLRLEYPTEGKPEMAAMLSYVASIESAEAKRAAEAVARAADVGTIFDALDVDNQGTIDVGEFLRLSETTGIPKSKLRQIFKERDVDGSGALDRDEFVRLVDECSLLGKVEAIVKLSKQARQELADEQRSKQELWRIGLPPAAKKGLAAKGSLAHRPSLVDVTGTMMNMRRAVKAVNTPRSP